MKVFFIIISLFSSLFLTAQKKIPGSKPKLIVGIVIEQMRYDYLYRFWDKFQPDGFKKLIGEGSQCKHANINYLFSQNAPGMASIVTGAEPAMHGIVSDDWYINLHKEKINCVFDKDEKGVGGSSKAGKVSPRKLMASTVSDELMLMSGKKSKVISVSLPAYPAVLSSGHMGDAYWFDEKKGRFISGSYYTKNLKDWVNEFNNKEFPDLYLSREWNTALPITDYTESLSDDNKYEKGYDDIYAVFPYNIPEMHKKRRDYELLIKIPAGNTLVKDFSIATIVNENLGKDDYPDILNVTFTVPEELGALFGPSSVEVQDMFLRLDRELAFFINFLEDFVGKHNCLIYLTSTSGTAEIPEYMKDNNMPAGVFKNHYALALLKAYLNALYGEGDWIVDYVEQQIFLNRNLIEDANLSLEEVQDKVAAFMLQFTGVKNAITASTMQKTNFTEGIFEKMQNSYSQTRSGDVMVNLEPGWIQDVYGVTDHNSGYTYDTHVPLIWYGWKIGRKSIRRPINITDIAPTLSEFLKINYPNSCTGKPIFELTEN